LRRVAHLALLAAVLAGCGGGGKETTSAVPLPPPLPTTTTTSGDPGKDAITALVAAAHEGRADAMWSMLSSPTKRRVGPLARFRAHAAKSLAQQFGSFGHFRVIVSERITSEFGVVAIDGARMVQGRRERDVYAAALRLEGSAWKFELGSPVRVRAVGPDPGAHEDVVAQIAAAVSGEGGVGSAVIYVDGLTENPKVYGTQRNSTLVVNYEPALDPGRHTVVVFGNVGRDASATAWWFTVARKPKP
jgi:hypothetical protein